MILLADIARVAGGMGVVRAHADGRQRTGPAPASGCGAGVPRRGYRQWLAAEAATNGFMLSQAGRYQGIDERSLFAGPESRVRKYASAELIEWFESHPRPTRVSWFGSASARRPHLAARRIG
jgi:hypothetical protein